MTFLLGALKFLRAIPWQVWLFAALALIGWRWHVNAVEKAVDLAVAEVQADWHAEVVQAEADAKRAREAWAAMVAERDAEIDALHAKQVADSAAFTAQLAKARKASAKLTQEITRVSIENPIAASCALSDERIGLRNEAIRQANAPTDGVTETPTSGLPRDLQAGSAGDTRIADRGTEHDISGGHSDYSGLWRIPTYTPSAG